LLPNKQSLNQYGKEIAWFDSIMGGIKLAITQESLINAKTVSLPTFVSHIVFNHCKNPSWFKNQ
jgi:hypothetical protein